MKKTIIILILLFTCFTSFGQSYLGQVNKQVNFREGAGINYPVISSLKVGAQIFIISLETENDFYNIIDIANDKEGYIHKSYVKIGKLVSRSSGGVFSPEGESSEYNPEISVLNNTSKKLSLKLNSNIYYFSPKESKIIKLEPGECDFRASAPGVQPYIGTEYLDGNRRYSWQFYITTKRR